MQEFRSYFQAFVAGQGGHISRERHQGSAHFISGIFPGKETLQRGDTLQSGLLLRTDDGEVQIQGYVMRLVCTNGMVVPDFHLHRSYTTQEWAKFEADLPTLLEAMSKRAMPQVCRNFMKALRRQADDWYLRMVIEEMQAIKSDTSWMHRLRQAARQEAERHLPFQRVNRARWRGHDHAHLSRFDVINGLTAVARDEADAHLQHGLESLAWRLLAQEESASSPIAAQRRRSRLLRDHTPVN
jgi:hypothetical protein